ncbi:hypothetical protein BC938DRAFT_477559 [Jimgerdemannia flammicorona]|uniref:Uncharacterized protein n=1 Tax=Jimgerdemannia flammicorona TaxID=994334 RepID=A0A433QP48_9FUNG|nr:hypothetical protein BC938DRAFT_477559 [Jimgerdemannia flammicorona]
MTRKLEQLQAHNATLENDVNQLVDRNQRLKERDMRLTEYNQELEIKNGSLVAQLANLRKYIKELESDAQREEDRLLARNLMKQLC